MSHHLEGIPETLLTPDEYLWCAIARCPDLYAYEAMERTRLAVFDQFFNTIGNGIRDDEELLGMLRPGEKVATEADALRWVGKTLYYGYHSVRTVDLGTRSHTMPDTSGMSVVVIDEERHLHQEVKKWVRCRHSEPDEVWVPYPNFKKEYSAVCLPAFRGLDPAWHDAAIWFYETARTFFETYPEKYHYAYPSDRPRDNERLIQAFQTACPRYDSHEAFGEAYGVPFTGDFDDFARRLWDKERRRCLTFIDETLTMLRGWRLEAANSHEARPLATENGVDPSDSLHP